MQQPQDQCDQPSWFGTSLFPSACNKHDGPTAYPQFHHTVLVIGGLVCSPALTSCCSKCCILCRITCAMLESLPSLLVGVYTTGLLFGCKAMTIK